VLGLSNRPADAYKDVYDGSLLVGLLWRLDL